MVFKYGFEINGIKYGWNSKKLFKLPHIKNNKYYSLKEIKPQKICGVVCYSIFYKKVTINKLKILTKKIEGVCVIINTPDVPF